MKIISKKCATSTFSPYKQYRLTLNCIIMANSLIYSRVSTSTQKTDRQSNELLLMTKNDGIHNPIVVSEKISGTKPLFLRKEGSKVKQMILDGDIDCIYVHEISRLGRNIADVANAIEFLIAHKCNLVVMMSNLRLFKDGEVDISARMVLNIMLSMAQSERDILSKRTKSGMALARSNGKQIGRSIGLSKEGIRVQDLLGKFKPSKVLEMTTLSRTQVYKINRDLNKV